MKEKREMLRQERREDQKEMKENERESKRAREKDKPEELGQQLPVIDTFPRLSVVV